MEFKKKAHFFDSSVEFGKNNNYTYKGRAILSSQVVYKLKKKTLLTVVNTNENRDLNEFDTRTVAKS